MPELPEVETVRRGLRPALEGAKILTAEVRRPDLRFPFPKGLADELIGARVSSVDRRAKYLVMHLDTQWSVIAHLGMSGSWRVEPLDGLGQNGESLSDPLGRFTYDRSTDRAHDHMVLTVTGGQSGPARLVYNDPRRFGFVLTCPTADLHDHKMIKNLGPEPTGNALTPAHLARAFRTKRAPIKAALLDQRVVAGLGNIYVCEALSRARLSPKRIASTLVRKNGTPTHRLTTLTAMIRQVIAEAIEAGGSSLRDHKNTDGSLGYFQHRFRVYDRAHEPCPTPDCRGTVRRIVQSGRSTFYCPTCQR